MDVDQAGSPEVGAEREFEPQGPRPIKKLSNDVINQIAAAEVGDSSLSTTAQLEQEENAPGFFLGANISQVNVM